MPELVSERSEDRPAELIARLNASANSASKVERRIAGYLLANLAELPFETGASLAEKAGVSAASISRFCRSIGYDDIKDLKASLKSGSSEPAWLIGDKLQEFHQRSLLGNRQLSIALEKEIAALTAVYALAVTAEFDRVVERLANRTKVFVAGFQAERGHGASLANNLQYLRPGVFQVDVAGGHFAEILLSDPSKTCLILFDGRRYLTVEEAAHIARDFDPGRGPLVIADYADNPGAGAYGDATNLLRALLDAGVTNAAFAPMVDPALAEELHRHREGEVVTVDLGGKNDPGFGGGPLRLSGQIMKLSDGAFRGDGPMLGGLQRTYGTTAVLRVDGIDILVVTEPEQLLDRQQLAAFGIMPLEKSVLALKSMQHFRAAFEPIAGKVIVCDSGALATPDLTRKPYRKVRRPVWPLDPETVYSGEGS